MFWGCVLKKGETFKVSEDDLSKLLHISSACLG